MRANRRTDTKPELALRHALHRLGYRYRKDYRLDLDGGRRVRPDIAFTARKVAVFVDGCFWHACPEHGSKPRANEWYWGPKLIKNVERDRINDAAGLMMIMSDGGVDSAKIADENRRHPISSVEDWWTIVLGSGYRATIEQLNPLERERVKEANLAFIRDEKISAIETNVLYALATKPG